MIGITVTVLRAGGRDPHGDPLPDEDHAVAGCIVAPRRSHEGGNTEVSDRGESLIVGYTLYAPFDADIVSTDRIRIEDPKWRGTFDVVGEPARWQSPYSNRKAGLEVALTRHG